MSEYTKGPWVISDADFNNVPKNPNAEFAINSEDGWHVAEILDVTNPEADARLIAAAPELLEACKEFVRKCECGEARSTRSYAQMKAAISKAEGRE
jgi:hypothetical protein